MLYILLYTSAAFYTLSYTYSYILQRGNTSLPPFLHSPSYILSILLYTMEGIISAPILHTIYLY